MSTLARVRNPYVRNYSIKPSTYYAKSPYTPYAGFFQNQNNISSQVYTDSIIRAISIFSVNDQNVIDSIRNKYHIRDNGNYQLSGDIGAGVGVVAGAGLSYALYGKTAAMLASQLAYSKAIASTGAVLTATSAKVGATSALTMNPVGWTIALAATVLAVAGTVMTSIELGRIAGSAVGSQEGRIALGNYLANLGNSMVRRPVTTVLTAATIYGTRFLTKGLTNNPFVRQGITMTAMRIVNPLAEKIDNEVFGKIDDEGQLTYTTLIALQGDLADNFSGTSLVKAGAIGAIKGKDEAVAQIAKMYGRHEEGFDPLDFADVREAYGVDIGTFGNGLIDILGEVLIDTDNNVNAIKNSYNKGIAKNMTKDFWANVLSDETGPLFQRYFEKKDGQVIPKDSFKQDFGHKKMERMIEGYLEKYKDPALAKTEAEYAKIEQKNTMALIALTRSLYTSIHKSLTKETEDVRGAIASKLTLEIHGKINDSFKTYSSHISKYGKIKKDYAESVNKIVEAQKEAYKKVQQQKNYYNFDKGLLKELETHKFEIHKERAMTMLYMQPALRAYSISNDNMMRSLGYFTRPVQSLLSSGAWKHIKRILGKSLRKADPFEKVVSIDDILFTVGEEGRIMPMTKEEYEVLRKKVEQLKKERKTKREERKRIEFVEKIGQDKLDELINKLNKTLESHSWDKLSPEKQIELEEKNKEVKDAVQLFNKEKEEAIKAFDNENQIFRSARSKINKLEKISEDMKIDEESIEESLKDFKIEFYQDGKKTFLDLNDDNDVKRITEETKKLQETKVRTAEQEENLQQMQMGLIFHLMKGQFKEQANEVTRLYNDIIDLINAYSVDFENDFAMMKFLISKTFIFNSSGDRVFSKEDFEKNIHPESQEGVMNEAMIQKVMKFSQYFMEVPDKEKEEIFNDPRANAMFKKFVEDYHSKDPIAFEKHLATDVFTFTKMKKDEDNVGTHFNNNPELFEALDHSLNSKEMLLKIDNALHIIGTDERSTVGVKLKKPDAYKTNTSFLTLKKSLTEVISKVYSKIKREDGTNYDDDFQKLLKGKYISNELVIKILLTRHFMSKKPESKGKSYKMFSQFTENDLNEYLFNIYKKKDKAFGEEAENIDKLLRTLQERLNVLEAGFSPEGKYNYLQKAVITHFNQKMSKIRKSNLIKAISAKYLKYGEKDLFYQINYKDLSNDPYTDEQIQKMISEKLPVTDSEDTRLKIFNEVKVILIKALETEKEILDLYTIKKDVIEELIDKTIKENSEKEVTQVVIDIKQKDAISKTKEKIVNIILKAKGELPEEDKQKLKTEIENKFHELIINFHDYRAARKSKDSISKRAKEVRIDTQSTSVLYNSIKNSPFSKFFSPKDLRRVLRGKSNKLNTKINLDKSPYRDSLLDYMHNNEPSLESIAILKSLPLGFFRTHSGVAVDFQRLSQLDQSVLPPKWREAEYGPMNKDYHQKVLDFVRFTGSDKGNKLQVAAINASYDLPHRAREHFKKNALTKTDFFKFEEVEKELEDSLAKDIYYELIKNNEDKKKVLISKEAHVIDDLGNKVRVITIILDKENSIEYYIPEAVEKNVYEIITQDPYNPTRSRRNRYIKQDIYGKDKDKKYVENVVKKIQKDLTETLRYHNRYEKGKLKDNKIKFIPFDSQSELFVIFNKQRFLEEENQFTNDFIYYDPDRQGDYTKFLTTMSARLLEGDKDLIEDDYRLFLEKADEEGFTKDVVQSDHKLMFKKIEVIDNQGKKQNVSILDIINPLAYRTLIANRSAHAAKALGNAIIKGNEEEAMISSIFASSAYGDKYKFKTGFNMRTLLMDVDDETFMTITGGKSTFEEAALLSASAAKKYFPGYYSEIDSASMDGFKLNDRHSGKYSFYVITDAQMRGLVGEGKDIPELILSKGAVHSRGLMNIKDEIALTSGKQKGEVEYLTRKEATRRAIELANKGDIDEGFLYMSLTDDLYSNDFNGYKVAGDDGYNGAKLSTEEMAGLASLSKVFDNPRYNKLFEYFMNKGKESFSDKEVLDEIYGNESNLLGKKGSLKKIIEKVMPNSAYGKLMPDMSLQPDEIKLPLKMLIEMGVIKVQTKQGKETTYEFVDEGSKYVMFHRYPHQGRRSMAHLKVVIDFEVGARVIKLNPWIVKSQNADFDGDGGAIFSYKGEKLGSEILKLSEKAFTHNYNENNLPKDMSKKTALEISTDKTVNGRDLKSIISEKRVGFKKDKLASTPKDFTLTEKDFDTAILRQTILKRYSAYLKDVFDTQIYLYELDMDNQESFKKFLTSDLNKDKDGKIIYRNFYELITELYDFYSQTTFDFSKHGSQAKAGIFRLIHDSIKNIQTEKFEDNIKRSVALLKLDKEITEKYDISITDKPEVKQEKEENYKKEMTEGIEKINKEYKVVIEDEVETNEMAPDPKLVEETKSKVNKTPIKSIDEHLKNKLNDFIKKQTNGMGEKIDSLKESIQTKDMYSLLTEKFGEEKEKFTMDEFNLSGKKEEQIFARMEEIEKKQSIGKPFKKRIDYNLRSFATKIVRNLGKSPAELRHIKLIFTTKEGKRYSYSFADLFQLTKKAEIFYFSPDRVKESSFKEINTSIFAQASIKEFHIEDTTGVNSEAIRKAAGELYFALGKTIVTFLSENGYTESKRVHPILHNAMIYNAGVLKELFLSLGNKDNKGKSAISKLLKITKTDEEIKHILEPLKRFFTYQYVAEYVLGKQRTNLFQAIYEIEGIFNNNNVEQVELKLDTIRSAMTEAGLIEGDSKILTEDFIKEIEKLLVSSEVKFKTDDEKISYLNRLFHTLMHINRGLPTKYNLKSNFMNALTFKDKIDMLIKIQSIRDGAFDEGGKEEKNIYGITKEDLEKNTKGFEKEIGKPFFTELYHEIDNIVSRAEVSRSISKENLDDIRKAIKKEKEVFNLVDIIINKINTDLQTKRFSWDEEMNTTNEEGRFIGRENIKLDNTKENIFIRSTVKKNKMVLNMELALNQFIYEVFSVRPDTELGKLIKEEMKKVKGFQDMSIVLYTGAYKTPERFIEVLEQEIALKSSRLPISEKKLSLFLHLNKVSKALGFDTPFLPHHFMLNMAKIKQASYISYIDDFDETQVSNLNHRGFYKAFYHEYMNNLQKGSKADKEKFKAIESEMNNFLNFFEDNANLNSFNMKTEDFVKVFFGNIMFERFVYSGPDKKINLATSQKIRRAFAEKYDEDLKIREATLEKKSYNITEKILKQGPKIQDDKIKELIGIENEEVFKEVLPLIRKTIENYDKAQKNLLPENQKQIDTYHIVAYEGIEGISKLSLYNIINRLYTDKDGRGLYHNEADLVEVLKQRIVDSNYKGTINPVLHSALMDAEMTLMAIEKLLEMPKDKFDKLTGTQKFIKDFSNKKNRHKYIIFDSENIVSRNTYNRIYEISYIMFDEDGNKIHKQFFLKQDIDEATIRWLERKGFTPENIKYILDKQKNVSTFDHNKQVFDEVFKDFNGKQMIGHSIKSNSYGDGDIQKLNYEYLRLYENEIRKVVATETLKDEMDIYSLKKMKWEDIIQKEYEVSSSKTLDLIIRALSEKLKDDLYERVLLEDIGLKEEHKETYIARIKAIFEIFLTHENREEIYAKIKEGGLLHGMDETHFNKLYELYQNALAKSTTSADSSKKAVMAFSIPKIVFDDTKKIYVIKWEKELGEKFYGVEFDENDVFSKVMFKSAAFYESLHMLKDEVRINEVTYSKYEFYKSQYIDIKVNDLYLEGPFKDDTMVSFQKELETYKAEGNEFGVLKTHHKMVQREKFLEKQKHGQLDEYVDYLITGKQIDTLPKTKLLATTQEWLILNGLKDYYDDFYDSVHAGKTPEQKDFNLKMKMIVHRLQIKGRNMPLEEFSKILGLDIASPATAAIQDKFIEEYDKLVSKGISITLKGDTDKLYHIKYSPEKEDIFIQNAFYKTIYDPDNFFDRELRGTETITFEKNDVKEKELEALLPNTHGRKIEIEYNKSEFAKERARLLQWLKEGNWEEIEKRFNEKPKSSEDISFAQFKKIFEDNLNQLKIDGYKKVEENFHIDTKESKNYGITRYKETDEIIPYIKGPIYDKIFIEKAYHMSYETISKHYLHIDSHKTALDDAPLNQKLSYDYYERNGRNYGVIRTNDGENRQLKNDKEIENSYDYASSRFDKATELSKYQFPFLDMINHFKINGEYDIDLIVDQMLNGELGKIYRLTMITDLSDKETGFIRDKIDNMKPGEPVHRTHMNREYNPEEIARVRKEYNLTPEQEMFSDESQEFMDTMRDTADPTLKVLELSHKKEIAKQQITNLINVITKNPDKYFIGFTTINDIFNTDRLSYQSYKLPKPIAWMQSTIIQTQKALMLMNFGFPVRNFFDGLQKNYHLVTGKSNIIDENLNFIQEGIRSWDLFFKFKRQNMINLDQISHMKTMLQDLKDVEEKLNTNPGALDDIKDQLRESLLKKVTAIELYLKNIIPDEAQKPNQRASSNYIELAMIAKHYQQIYDELKTSDQKTTKVLMEDFVMSYVRSGFYKQIVMNSTHKNASLNFGSNDSKHVRKTKDYLELLKFVNMVEKSNIISSQYELGEKKKTKEIYDEIDDIIKGTHEEVSLAERINKMMNGSWNIIKTATDYIEHTQRLHGVLLDYYHNGRSTEAVLADSLDRFFNYGMKGAEEIAAGVYFPFMSFAVRNLDLYMQILGNQKYVRFMTNLAQGMNTWYDEDDEEDDYRKSNFFTDFTENQGWFPMGKNYGVKLGNSMFDSLSFTNDPVSSFRQKLNPMIQQINNLTKGEKFDYNRLATATAFNRTKQMATNVATGNVRTPADVMPSLFYKRSEFTPSRYRRSFTTDFRNINRSLYFQDGSRRTPSRNPYTTARNIRYQAYARARNMGAK
jgi:hypothetical protein